MAEIYEQLRADMAAELLDEGMEAELAARILARLDKVAGSYEIKRPCMELAVCGREEFESILRNYIAALGCEGKSRGTLKQYYYCCEKFIQAARVPIEEITANMIRSYLFEYQQKNRISDRTLESMRVMIHSFFQWAADEEYIPKSPAARVNRIRYERKPRQALQQLQLEHLRKACRNARERCIIEVLYSTGCRVGEMVGIRLEDIRGDRVEVLGKGKKRRTVYLNAKALVAMEDYLAEKRHPSEWLISNTRSGAPVTTTSIQKLFRGLCERSGISCTPHVLRHTFATQAVKTVGVEKVQLMLGHANVATTMVYAHVDDSDLRQVHARAIV